MQFTARFHHTRDGFYAQLLMWKCSPGGNRIFALTVRPRAWVSFPPPLGAIPWDNPCDLERRPEDLMFALTSSERTHGSLTLEFAWTDIFRKSTRQFWHWCSHPCMTWIELNESSKEYPEIRTRQELPEYMNIIIQATQHVTYFSCLVSAVDILCHAFQAFAFANTIALCDRWCHNALFWSWSPFVRVYIAFIKSSILFYLSALAP